MISQNIIDLPEARMEQRLSTGEEKSQTLDLLKLF